MLNDNIYQDVLETLKVMENQGHSDKVQTLTLLLEKYVHKNKATHLMNNKDLTTIVDDAKTLMAHETFPKFLQTSGRLKTQLDQEKQIQLCIVEATIGHLNRLECFKRLPKFDFKDNKF
ncbi:MAG TPA: hypothetical protein VI911_11650 [Patescibacteria group bacterium]|nr:hypothetical protein [Patescibacteria group bacterium]